MAYVANMPERSLPAPCLLVDEERIGGITTVVEHLGGYDLTTITTVGPLALDVQTAVHSHPLTYTTIAPSASEDQARRRLGRLDCNWRPLQPDRQAQRVLEHCAELRGAAERLTGRDVRIELDDAALGITTFSPLDPADASVSLLEPLGF